MGEEEGGGKVARRVMAPRLLAFLRNMSSAPSPPAAVNTAQHTVEPAAREETSANNWGFSALPEDTQPPTAALPT